MTSYKSITHLIWHYPFICQTKKEDFVELAKSIAGGEVISVSKTSNLKIIKKIFGKCVHAHGRGFPFPELASLFAKKSIYTPHNDTIGSRTITRLVRRFVFNRYDKIICQTQYGKNSLAKAGVKIDKIVVIPNPVDYNFFSKPKGGEKLRKKIGLNNEFFAVTIGIRPLKNPEVIAKACEKAGIKVVMIGPYKKNEAERHWKGKGFEWYLPPKEIMEYENVILTGQLSAKEVLAVFDAADIYINSSDYENFGIAVYEAASAGLPLCLPNYGTFDVFKNASLFHEPKNYRQLSRNIKIYLNRPELRKKHGKEAKKIAKKFDYYNIKKMYEDFFNSFLKNKL